MRYVILCLVLLASVNASAFDAKFSAEVSGYFNSHKLTFRNLDTDFRANTIGATGKVLTGGCIIKYTFAQGFRASNEFLITEPFELNGVKLVEKAATGTTQASTPKPIAFSFDNPFSHTLEICYVDGRLKPLIIIKQLGVNVEAINTADDGKITRAADTFTRTNMAAGGAGYYNITQGLVVEGKAAFSDKMQLVNLGLYVFRGPDFFAHVGYQYELQKLGDVTLKTSTPFVGLQYNF